MVLIQVNCSVIDCKYQIRLNCSKPVIEVDKVGRCVSFVHLSGSQNRDLGKIYPGFIGEDSSKKF